MCDLLAVGDVYMSASTFGGLFSVCISRPFTGPYMTMWHDVCVANGRVSLCLRAFGQMNGLTLLRCTLRTPIKPTISSMVI